MLFELKDGSASIQAIGTVVSLRCPVCRQRGTFEARVPGMVDLHLVSSLGVFFLGQRSCPNPSCRTHVFFAYDAQKRDVAVSYPAERIDFDATNIPQPVVSALSEAITCHANECFIAAAIMVRKTLEELCSDRGANGSDLKQRIKALGKTIILPPELLDGLDELRLLGNDAAHIESKEYSKVDQEEVEVAIEITKEVLKAAYQYSAIIGRLKALKKIP